MSLTFIQQKIYLGLSFIYALARFSYGLLVHPYQTMQLVLKEKFFIWLILVPTLTLGLITGIWHWLTLSLLAEIANLRGVILVGNWVTFFCFYWQVMLFYLWLRFWLANKKIRSDK